MAGLIIPVLLGLSPSPPSSCLEDRSCLPGPPVLLGLVLRGKREGLTPLSLGFLLPLGAEHRAAGLY